MNFSPISDIAQNLMMRRRGNSLRQELSSLTQELASGTSRDIATKLRGNFSTIAAVEHSIQLQDGFASSRNLAKQVLDTSQFALGAMQELVDDIGGPLLAAATPGSGIQFEPFVARGEDLFDDLTTYANTQHAGRFVFAGVAFNSKPVQDSQTMLSDIASAVSGAGTAADFSTAIDAWFETPGSGFQDTGYNGGDPAAGDWDISESQSISFELTAKDQAFRDAFKHAATLALIDRGDFSGAAEERTKLLQTAATGLIDASGNLVAVQAKIGSSQQRIEAVNTQVGLELQMLNSVKNDIVSVDPYEVATKLEATQTQLESLYLVTARTSRLNLSEYLR